MIYIKFLVLFLQLLSFFAQPHQNCYCKNNLIESIVLKKSQKLSTLCASHIKSLKAYPTGWELNNPTVRFNSDETITIEFDDIQDTPGQYEYTIIHCDYEWEPTNLYFMEYAEGFEYNPITNYTYSSGTQSSYTHYKLTLPNDETKFKLTGNYIVKIVDQTNRYTVVVQQQIRIYEPLVRIDALIRKPVSPNIQNTHQQMELTLNTALLGSIDPTCHIRVKVMLNNQPFNAQWLQPQFINGNQLVYHTSTQPIFEGGNEYRQLNLKSFHYQTPSVNRIEQYGGEFHVTLTHDTPIKTYRYSEAQDLNGRYLIKCDDVNDSQTEAEYAWVYFTLAGDRYYDGDVYVFGELSNWELLPNFKMKYNEQTGVYELKTLLKQGFYNYRYVFVANSNDTKEFNRIESTFYETENTYFIYVYFKPDGARHWQLLGFQGINSRVRV